MATMVGAMVDMEATPVAMTTRTMATVDTEATEITVVCNAPLDILSQLYGTKPLSFIYLFLIIIF